MNSVTDPYREWDAAYVMGSLPSSERHEYEQHMASCPACSAAVAELAGIPGVLRSVRAERAMDLLADESASEVGKYGPVESEPVPPTLLPRFVDATRRARNRARVRAVSWTVGGLAAAAAAVLVIVLALGLIGSPAADTRELAMTQTAPGPITAEVALIAQPWGTTIQLECYYATWFDGRPTVGSTAYSLVVIDRSGVETEQATWEATPGSTVTPTATTVLSIDEIERVEIRLIESGRVLLEASPGP